MNPELQCYVMGAFCTGVTVGVLVGTAFYAILQMLRPPR